MRLVARPRQPLVPLTAQVRDAVAAAVERLLGMELGAVTDPGRWRRRLSGRRGRRDSAGDALVRSRRAGRRLALASVFEAEFGQRTADAILERHLATEGDPETAALARELVANVVRYRDLLDARITAAAPQYPVVQLARDGPRAAPLRPMRGVTLARNAGPGGDRRVGRARTDVLRRTRCGGS